jgi:hypothetical protein
VTKTAVSGLIMAKYKSGHIVYRNKEKNINYYSNGKTYNSETNTIGYYHCGGLIGLNIVKGKKEKDKSKETATAESKDVENNFNNDMKKLVEVIKDYRNQWGFYRIKSSEVRFYNNFDKQIFSTTNIPEKLANIPPNKLWMYKPDTKTIFFYEADKSYYVHKIT